MDDKVRISHVARLLGVTPHYIRMLERAGRIPEASYDRAGRFYADSDVALLRAMGIGSKPERLRPPEEVIRGA